MGQRTRKLFYRAMDCKKNKINSRKKQTKNLQSSNKYVIIYIMAKIRLETVINITTGGKL